MANSFYSATIACTCDETEGLSTNLLWKFAYLNTPIRSFAGRPWSEKLVGAGAASQINHSSINEKCDVERREDED